MAAKKRAIATPESSVGSLRHDTYRRLISRINESHTQGFYLESITLCESIIADRLEHRLNYLAQNTNTGAFVSGQTDFSFKNLGYLILEMKKFDSQAIALMDELDNWRIDRNKSVHEMAKIEENSAQTWEDKIIKAHKVSSDGITLMKKIKNTID